jgi:hypothetical protein
MLIELDYRGHHIEVYAAGLQGAWDAIVRIRRSPSGDQVYFDRVPFGAPTADLAEAQALMWAKHWVESSTRSD